MLRKRTDPFNVEISTGFMVAASTRVTEGRESPTAMGLPRSFALWPPLVIEPPGDAELFSTAMLGRLAAQPTTKRAPTESASNTLFFRFIFVPPLGRIVLDVVITTRS
jgi:hypothetical protein